jgi:hypothetical protein
MTSVADCLPGELPLQQIRFGHRPEKSGRSLSSPVPFPCPWALKHDHVSVRTLEADWAGESAFRRKVRADESVMILTHAARKRTLCDIRRRCLILNI